jgi:hypothetical protein
VQEREERAVQDAAEGKKEEDGVTLFTGERGTVHSVALRRCSGLGLRLWLSHAHGNEELAGSSGAAAGVESGGARGGALWGEFGGREVEPMGGWHAATEGGNLFPCRSAIAT